MNSAGAAVMARANRWVIGCWLFWGLMGWAQAAEVRGFRIWTSPENTRLVFDITSNVKQHVFTEAASNRLIIDMERTQLTRALPFTGADDPFIHSVHSTSIDDKDLRFVVQLKTPARVKSFHLQPNREYGHRLVVDLFPGEPEERAAAPVKVVKDLNTTPSRSRDVIVAIDAGHGGEDPGAKGPRGTYEKHVTLAVARKLAALVAQQRGMRAVLIRDGDYYIGLRQRIQKAHRLHADLFVSIHADAFRDATIRGSSVYTLSQRGASSEAARWLADRENAADLIGGVSLDDKDDVLASVLLDLSQSGTMQASSDVAEAVLDELQRLGAIHRTRVQQAGFAVLKSPDIPSILVETAFISNPLEENKLTDPAHQEKLARRLLSGIRGYFQRYAPPGTLLAQASSGGDHATPTPNPDKTSGKVNGSKNSRMGKSTGTGKGARHTIARGDTLSTIAQQYSVSLASLREVNRISSDDNIRIGQVLYIPGS
jgi:N-acetylmuramoyl-L-alanine amidase